MTTIHPEMVIWNKYLNLFCNFWETNNANMLCKSTWKNKCSLNLFCIKASLMIPDGLTEERNKWCCVDSCLCGWQWSGGRNAAHSKLLKTSEIFQQCFPKHSVRSLEELAGIIEECNVNCFISPAQRWHENLCRVCLQLSTCSCVSSSIKHLLLALKITNC